MATRPDLKIYNMIKILPMPYIEPLLLLLVVLTNSVPECNFTHLQYFSKYSLGKEDQLNRTFRQVEGSLKLGQINLTAADTSRITIKNIKVKLYYIDSHQKAEIIGRDTVVVYGGFLQTDIAFDWVKETMILKLEGTAYATILSDQVMFEKTLVMDMGYLSYKLAYYYNVTFNSRNFTISRITPATTLPQDIQLILQGLNMFSPDFKSAKQVLQDQLSIDFGSLLSSNLKNQHYPLDDHFQYEWVNPWSGRKSTIPFKLIPTGVDLEKNGLKLNFVTIIDNYDGWTCGPAIPTQELDPKVYGGVQEFVGLWVFENLVKFAIQTGVLDTELNRANWQSRMFQFFAGDLYQIIPAISQKYTAQTPTEGLCKALPTSPPKLVPHNSTFVNTTTNHKCTLSIMGTNILEFDIQLSLQLQIIPNASYLNVRVASAKGDTVFRDVKGFQLANRPLAGTIVAEGVGRLTEGVVFGSGWKVFPRDYPHVLMQNGYILIYDSTHIDTANRPTRESLTSHRRPTLLTREQ